MTLSEYLKQAGERQGSFAARLNTTDATISRIISGANKPSLELAAAIEAATGGKVSAISWVGYEPAVKQARAA